MGLVSEIISRIRRRCDMVGSTFISDTNDLLPWITASQRELYDLVNTAYGNSYFMTIGAFTLTATQYWGIEGMQKLIRLDTAFDGVRVPFRKFDPAEIVLDDTAQAWDAGTDIRYHLSKVAGSTHEHTLWFQPRPSGNYVVAVYYIPGLGVIDSASVETIEPALVPWDEYIVVDCAIRAKVKEDADPQALMVEKAALRQRIVDTAANTDVGQPLTVPDVQSIHGSVDGRGGRGGWW